METRRGRRAGENEDTVGKDTAVEKAEEMAEEMAVEMAEDQRGAQRVGRPVEGVERAVVRAVQRAVTVFRGPGRARAATGEELHEDEGAQHDEDNKVERRRLEARRRLRREVLALREGQSNRRF